MRADQRWNFPIFLPWRKLVSALAAGCTVVMKPSPETATTSVAMAILAQRAGVPDGVVNVITTNAEDTPAVGKLLCEDKRIKKMHFTGSTSVSAEHSGGGSTLMERWESYWLNNAPEH